MRHESSSAFYHHLFTLPAGLEEIAFSFVFASSSSTTISDVISPLPRISRCLLPVAFNSKWLFAGTYTGNVYVINLDTFALSPYKIMWNDAIGMYVSVRLAMLSGERSPFVRSRSTHPGVVVDLCQNPNDPTRVSASMRSHALNGRFLVRTLALHRLQHTSSTHGADFDWTRDLLEFEAKAIGKCLYDPTCK